MKKDRLIAGVLLVVALTALTGLAMITLFIFKEGLPFILKTGPGFFFSADWAPPHSFGIGSMIVGSLVVTAGAMIVAAVFGLGCAVVLTQFCPPRLMSILKPSIELLAGIPSVVYGFLGMMLLTPFIMKTFGGTGQSVLAASIVLGIMVLPTVTSISIDALLAVPRPYYEGSIAMGATKLQTTRMVMLKAARNGILAAFILGIGRAVGETMAVIMVAGNALRIPTSVLSPVRTLTATIVLEMGYAAGDHLKALFAVGVTLFAFIMVLNVAAMRVAGRGLRRAAQR